MKNWVIAIVLHHLSWQVYGCEGCLSIVFVTSGRQQANTAKIFTIFINKLAHSLPFVRFDINGITDIVTNVLDLTKFFVRPGNDPALLGRNNILEKL